MASKKRLSHIEMKAPIRVSKRCGKIMMHGMTIDIPAELDLSAGAPFEGRPLPATMRIPQDIQELFGPLVELATNAWRLKTRMTNPDTGEPKEETAKLYRFVEGLFRALRDAGVQVIDKTGKAYNTGMPEKVITFEQMHGLLKEEIIETARPTIRWKERTLFCGEIIVGIPVIETPQERPQQEQCSPASASKPETPPQNAETAAPPQGQVSQDAAAGDAAATPRVVAASTDQLEPISATTPTCQAAAVPQEPSEPAPQFAGAEQPTVPAESKKECD